jgi:hypothetical protein
MTPDIDMDNVVLAVLLVAVMLVSMRLLYGYWPWQLHPKVKRMREIVIQQVMEDPAAAGFSFEPITASPILGVANENGDTFVRQTGGEPETTSPPKGTNRTEENL